MKLILSLIICLWVIKFQSTNDEYTYSLSVNPKYKNCYLIIRLKDKKYLIILNDDLHKYYLKFRNSIKVTTYKDFLNGVLNNQFTVDTSKIEYKKYLLFQQNNEILKNYKMYGLKFIMMKYLDDRDHVLKNKPNDQKTLNNIIAIMIGNNYYVTFSDYSGYYYFTSK